MESPSLLFRFRTLGVRFGRSHRVHFPPRHESLRELQVLLPGDAARVPRVPLLARPWFPPPASPGTWIPASPQAFFQAPIFFPARLACPSLAMLHGPCLPGPPARHAPPPTVPAPAPPDPPPPLSGASPVASPPLPSPRAEKPALLLLALCTP